MSRHTNGDSPYRGKVDPDWEAVVEEYERYRLLHPDEDLADPAVDDPALYLVDIAEHAVRSGAWESVTYEADQVFLPGETPSTQHVLRAGEAALAMPAGQRPLWVRNQGTGGPWTGRYTMTGEVRQVQAAVSMTADQREWLTAQKNAGRLECDQCGRAIASDEPTLSEGWPDGSLKVFCQGCADAVDASAPDHFEVIDTETGESERIEPEP